MSFNATVPDGGDPPDQFPAQCTANWARLETMISADHQFNAGASSSDGKHNKVRFIQQSTAPTTTTNELALYTKSVSGSAEVFLRRPSNGTEIQLSSGTPTAATSGKTFLPGGLMLQWGTKTNPNTSGSVSFNPVFSATPYNIQLTLQHNSSGDESATISASTPPTTGGFNYRTTSSSANTSLLWIAIGTA